MTWPLTLELVKERTRETERMAAEAGRLRMLPRPPRPDRGSSVRRLAARPVRALSDASRALSEAACTAALKIEGQAR